MKNLLLAAAALTVFSTTVYAADAKSYQVTGPVLAMTDSTITVQKGSEKWELNKGSANIPADVKVGSKITAQYTMTASSIEEKAPSKKK